MFILSKHGSTLVFLIKWCLDFLRMLNLLTARISFPSIRQPINNNNYSTKNTLNHTVQNYWLDRQTYIQILRLQYNTDVHYSVHISHTTVPVLSRIKQTWTSSSILAFRIFPSHKSLTIPNDSVEFSDKHFAHNYPLPRPSNTLSLNYPDNRQWT